MKKMIFDLVRDNKLENVKEFFKKNPGKIDDQNEFGDTCLHLACSYGYKDIVIFLIKAGANIHTQNDDGDTCLHLACWYGHKDLVVFLIKAGVNINKQNKYGYTCLDFISRHRQDIIEFLERKSLKRLILPLFILNEL